MIDIRIVEQPNEKTDITKKIMHSLPAWFSPPEDIEKKAIIHRDYPFFAAYDGNMPVGFAALKIHNSFTADIFNVGVLEQYHRQGIGRCLLDAIERYCVDCGYLYLTVKTLDSSAKYEPYEKTRAFYRKVGFVPLEVFTTFWNEENPCLFMVKHLVKHDSLRVIFPSAIPQLLSFVVIAAMHDNKWIYVQHKDRDTYEVPGGHIEPGEAPIEAAKRELYEESGAADFTLDMVCPYGVERDGALTSYGLLYFAQVARFDELPNFEIVERAFFESMPERLTYPNIQPLLMKKVQTWLKEKCNGHE